MFKVEFIGNLGADAEVKDVNGSKFVAFRVAHVEKWTDENGNTFERTEWADCTMNNVESKVIPFLKTGVKVFVRGNGSMRVYSSAKERKMKAGIKISVMEVELCGGQSELVPRQIIDPATGALLDVTKFYWCNADTKGMKKDEYKEFIDVKGRRFLMNKQGFVVPIPENNQSEVKQENETTEKTEEK